jgi:hypothetical protein
MLAEEHHGTAVRKDEASVRQPACIIIMVSDLFEEWFHVYKDSLINCQITAQTPNFVKI